MVIVSENGDRLDGIPHYLAHDDQGIIPNRYAVPGRIGEMRGSDQGFVGSIPFDVNAQDLGDLHCRLRDAFPYQPVC